MQNQSELTYNQSVLMLNKMGEYYRCFREEIEAIKDVQGLGISTD